MTHKSQDTIATCDFDEFAAGGPAVTDLTLQSQEAFFAAVSAHVREFEDGRRVDPITTVSFESVGAFLSVMTPKRYALMEAVKHHGRFASIEALATALQRDRGTVSRDVKALASAGLIRLIQAVHSGHGRRSEIVPAGSHMKVELTF